MRKMCATGATILLFAVIARAQLPTGGNVFLGYSYTHGEAFTNNTIAGASMNGWDVSAEGKFLPWIGAIIDFDWHYGGQATTFLPVSAHPVRQKGSA